MKSGIGKGLNSWCWQWRWHIPTTGTPPLRGGKQGRHGRSECSSLGHQGLPTWIPSSVTPPSPEECKEGQGLCHGHCYLFDEAGQIYVPFWKACTFMGAQGDMHLKQKKHKFRAGQLHWLHLRETESLIFGLSPTKSSRIAAGHYHLSCVLLPWQVLTAMQSHLVLHF